MTDQQPLDSATSSEPQAAVAEPSWRVLGTPTKSSLSKPPSARRVALGIVGSSLVVLVAVAVLAGLAARRLAEREAVHDAAVRTDLIAQDLIQPALTNDLTSADPAQRAQALKTLDQLIRTRVLDETTIRVKIWSTSGDIVYSDESQLIGRQYELGQDEKEVLKNPETRADISDTSKPENEFERGQGKILEVYRPVWTATGQPFIFETYSPYDEVLRRSAQLWRGFAGLLISSLLALVILLLPLVIRLWRGLLEVHARREEFLHQAADASLTERRRIAGALHDGAVQELAGSTFALAGLAQKISPKHALEADRIVQSLRTSVSGMRSLLVQIYPPNLATAGLAAALTDLAETVKSRGIKIELELPEKLDLSAETERLIYRVAQECLRNISKHSQAKTVHLWLSCESRLCTLKISDDGLGFSADLFENPDPGHFGLQILSDLATESDAQLRVQTAPGHGTTWELTCPQGTS